MYSSNEISNEWANDINQYNYNKKNLEWGYNPPAKRITSKEMHESYNIFNPILQKYNSCTLEDSITKHQKKELINHLAKSQVLLNTYF